MTIYQTILEKNILCPILFIPNKYKIGGLYERKGSGNEKKICSVGGF